MTGKTTLQGSSSIIMAKEHVNKCGDCLHFKQHAHPSNGSVCNTLGIKHYNPAPRCFTPDISQITSDAEDLAMTARIFSEMTPKQRHIFVALLRTASPKRQFQIGQRVYFKPMGADYVSNYVAGYVMGYTSSKQAIVCGSPEARTRGRMYMAYMDADSLMLPSEWKKKLHQLHKANRVIDPNGIMPSRKKIDENYEPPTLDRAPSAVRTLKDKTTTVKRGKRDLVDIISMTR